MDEADVLVSIIVVTYNSSGTVLETLESICNQTYQNIELIVTDDCSEDNTVEVCRKWLSEYGDRFVKTELLTVPENSGIPANCNRGIRASNGEWIKIIAGDDILLQNCIFEFVKYIGLYPDRKIIFSDIELFGEGLDDFWISFWKENFDLFRKCTTAKTQYQSLLKKNYLPAPSCFMKRSVFEELGGYDEQIIYFEDYPFWLKATSAGYTLHLLEKRLVKYRLCLHSVSTCTHEKISFFGYRFSVKEMVFRIKYIKRYFLFFPLLAKMNTQKNSYRDGLCILMIRFVGKVIYFR